MLHKVLTFKPTNILRSGQIPGSVTLYGGENEWGQITEPDGTSATAWLFFAAEQWRTINSLSSLQEFAAEVRGSTSLATDRLFAANSVVPGWAGYFAYEAGKAIHGFETNGTLAEFGFFPLIIKLDLKQNSAAAIWLESLPAHEVDQRLSWLQTWLNDARPQTPVIRHWQSRWSQNNYSQAYNRVQSYLHSGDCYQVNLAMPFLCNDDLSGVSAWPLLERFSPRFGGTFHSPATTLLSVSPERFIHISNGDIETRPIKGTAPRGTTADSDNENREWLRHSAKNQAENLMIVDLLRNDLSLHATTGSVKVPKLFEIETHANVHHMVSTVTARLADGAHAIDVILSALPGGSITGAPKKRAMEIIDELEVAGRGPYCGILGYFGADGSCDFNILIRTIVAVEDGTVCWGGGGVVVDSEAQSEWDEIHNKVSAILQTPL